MTDTTTQKPLTIHVGDKGYSHLIVPVSQLEQVKSVLDSKKVIYAVDEEFLTVDDDPEVAFISFSLNTDVTVAQKALDSIP